MVPPWASTIRFVAARPSPAPLIAPRETPLRRKGSNARSRCSPVKCPRLGRKTSRIACPSAPRRATDTRLPEGEYFTALLSRLLSVCSITRRVGADHHRALRDRHVEAVIGRLLPVRVHRAEHRLAEVAGRELELQAARRDERAVDHVPEDVLHPLDLRRSIAGLRTSSSGASGVASSLITVSGSRRSCARPLRKASRSCSCRTSVTAISLNAQASSCTSLAPRSGARGPWRPLP